MATETFTTAGITVVRRTDVVRTEAELSEMREALRKLDRSGSLTRVQLARAEWLRRELDAVARRDGPTAKQADFIERLVADIAAMGRTVNYSMDALTKDTASEFIDGLLKRARQLRAEQAEDTVPVELETGMYRRDGEVYKVVESQIGRMYAKRLLKDEDGGFSFEYAAGAVKKLVPSDRLSLEDAAEFGRQFGTCCVCARTLTNPKSVEAGIGPVCRTRI